MGALAMWVPWEFSDTRPIFSFYASAVTPFMIIAICLAIGHILGRDTGPTLRRTVGTVVCGSFFVLVLLNFRSEEHTSALPSLMRISSAVFCLQTTQSTACRTSCQEIV